MKVFTLSTAVLLNALALLTPLTEAAPTPDDPFITPRPVPVSIARKYLETLTIQPKYPEDSYDDKYFPHWTKKVWGGCDTSELVLMRDGSRLSTGAECAVLWGVWYSPFDGLSVTIKDGVSVTSIVPNHEAWVSGASGWTTGQREAFANDLIRPQLLTVTDSAIKARGDLGPARWMPRVPTYQCLYIRSWITVKHYYDLIVDQAEHDALAKYLDACPEDDA